MATSAGRSALRAYLAMAGVAAAVFIGLTAVSDPAHTPPEGGGSPEPTGAVRAPSLERDFLTAVLGRPRISRDRPYCDRRGCCPTWRTVFGTTAPEREVIAAFAGQGYAADPGPGTAGGGGPFPSSRWVAELDLGGRWTWRRIEVAGGADVGRSAWPTVFIESSIACGQR
jgi:hypothetical protein